jgi:hypothetical protein
MPLGRVTAHCVEVTDAKFRANAPLRVYITAPAPRRVRSRVRRQAAHRPSPCLTKQPKEQLPRSEPSVVIGPGVDKGIFHHNRISRS